RPRRSIPAYHLLAASLSHPGSSRLPDGCLRFHRQTSHRPLPALAGSRRPRHHAYARSRTWPPHWRALAKAPAATSSRNEVPSWSFFTSIGNCLSAGVSCISPARGSRLPKERRSFFVVGKSGGYQVQLGGGRGANTGDQHSSADIGQKFSACAVHESVTSCPAVGLSGMESEQPILRGMPRTASAPSLPLESKQVNNRAAGAGAE